MRQSLVIFAVLVVHVYSAPQFITLNDGKLGVNFGGYSAGVGLGGLLGGGAGGGLFAEAGTPYGQAARAGLGGGVGGNSGTAGGLFAGATAGGNVQAAAGLGGAVGAENSAGGGYASASAAGNHATSGLVRDNARARRKEEKRLLKEIRKALEAQERNRSGGDTSFAGSSGFSFAAKKSYGAPTVVKETEYVITPVETVKEKKIYKEVNLEASNEITPVASAGVNANAHVDVNVDENANQPTVIVKEVSKRRPIQNHRPIVLPDVFKNVMISILNVPHVENRQSIGPVQRKFNVLKQVYVEPPPTKVIEKHIIHTHKPHRHHFRKTAYVGGFIGGGAGLAPPAVVQPTIERRVDVGAEADVNAGAEANVGGYTGGAGGVTYTKKVSVASNPGFFEDIFNIPISTLRAVGSLLSNVAGNTKVSVEKSAAVQASAGGGGFVGAESDLISPKHASPSSVSASESHISVETPSVSSVIDDIFSIPINTLTAVNKFLGNNVVGRKRAQASQDGTGEPTRVRLGPHARRRANKQVVIVQESNDTKKEQDSH